MIDFNCYNFNCFNSFMPFPMVYGGFSADTNIFSQMMFQPQMNFFMPTSKDFPISNFNTQAPKHNNHLKKMKLKYNENNDTFEEALKFTLKSEGGRSNNRNDKGGATNLGITQNVYNAYRKESHLTPQDVNQITMNEAKKIYHDKYWVASGANKLSNKKEAIALFDTAVLHGVSGASKLHDKSNGDLNKFLELREQKYSQIVSRDATQGIFFKGWQNRVSNLEDYLGVNEKGSYA